MERIAAFQINDSVNYEPENLFKRKFLVIKDRPNSIRYKFYSDSATVEEGQISFR